jgi:hypothetical protein
MDISWRFLSKPKQPQIIVVASNIFLKMHEEMFVVENDMCVKVKHYHNSHAWCQTFYLIRTTQFSLGLDYPWPSRVS